MYFSGVSFQVFWKTDFGSNNFSSLRVFILNDNPVLVVISNDLIFFSHERNAVIVTLDVYFEL